MAASVHLAFDLGAESGRALAGTLDGGRLTVEEIHRFENRAIEVVGGLHWDFPRLWAEMQTGLRRCADRGVIPQSVGVDTWGVDFGLLDENGKLLDLPRAYRDPRNAGAMESFLRRVPRESVYAATGIQFLPFNSLYQLEAMRRDGGSILDSAHALLFLPDLFHYLLTGVKRSEFTFATTTQLFNPVAGTWDEGLLDAVRVPPGWMQKIVQPGTVLGPIENAVAAANGFPKVPVVAVATHDTGSAVAAVPAEGEGWAYISSGTWSLVGVESKTPVLTEAAREQNVTNEGGVGGTVRVLRNVMGLWLLQRCRHAWGGTIDYETLVAEANGAAPLASIIDPDRPVFLNPDDMPKAIADECRRTGQPEPETRSAFTRCVLESVALKYRWVLERVAGVTGARVDRVHVIGGGSRNELLCRMTANACGVPVFAGPAEATGIGNLLVQAMAAGAVESLAHLRAIVRDSFSVKRYEPADAAQWDEAWRRFNDLGPE